MTEKLLTGTLSLNTNKQTIVPVQISSTKCPYILQWLITAPLESVVVGKENHEWPYNYFMTKSLVYKWAAPSEFVTYRLCEQRRFRRACASAQSRQNLRCSLIQAVSQEEPSDRKPDPWPLWMAGHAQLKFVMTECSKTQIRLARLKYNMQPTALPGPGILCCT